MDREDDGPLEESERPAKRPRAGTHFVAEEEPGLFDLLPDPLVARVFELLDPIVVFDEARLHAMSRRLQRIASEVYFAELNFAPRLRRLDDFAALEGLLARTAARLRSGAMQGAAAVLLRLPTLRLFRPRHPEINDGWTRAVRRVGEAAVRLVAAAAGAGRPPRALELEAADAVWPDSEEQEEAGLAPLPFAAFARQLLAAVGTPAAPPLAALRVTGRLAREAAALPPDELAALLRPLGALEELRLASDDDDALLAAPAAAAAAAALPALRRAALAACDGAALAPLAALPALEELRAFVAAPAGVPEALAAASPALRVLRLAQPAAAVPLPAPAARGLLRLAGLQELRVRLDAGAAARLAGLAALPALRELELALALDGAGPAPAALRAAAAGLAACGRLRTLDLAVEAGLQQPLDAAAAEELMRAAAPALRRLRCRSAVPGEGELRAAAAAPGLREVEWRHRLAGGPLAALEPYRALAGALPPPAAGLRADLQLAVPAALLPAAAALLRPLFAASALRLALEAHFAPGAPAPPPDGDE